MLSLALLTIGALVGSAVADDTIPIVECRPSDGTIYDFQANNIYGNETISFSDYQNKV